MRTFALALSALSLLAAATPALSRTVYRCVRDGTVSLSTAPEPGSRCVAKQLDDSAALLPNLWGSLGDFDGTLYRREQDGMVVYGTRELPGSVPVQSFAISTPATSSAHAGLGRAGAARVSDFRREFREAARKTGVDEAWLRTIAHVESYYDAGALSDKGAKGVMQLMPDVIAAWGVDDPWSAAQSILAGARQLRALEARYEGDLVLVAAAYNAGVGAVEQHGGVPPYPETREYVAKVEILYPRYRKALGLAPRSVRLQPAR